jgi:HTH-type transcriptional regulator, global nitrogen regulator NrpRI
MEKHRKRVQSAILHALQQAKGPVGSARIAAYLQAMGMTLQQRAIRIHLAALDEAGCTRLVSRRLGREITERGLEVLAGVDLLGKLGFISAKADDLVYRMGFDIRTGRGELVVNLSLIDESAFGRALEVLRPVFKQGYGVGSWLAVLRESEQFAGDVIPPNKIGLGTVCSMSMNGILLRQAIPVTSRFGGLLQIRDGQPVQFQELIEYSGTTMDPMEVFLRMDMTRVRDCTRSGRGLIYASFREIPAHAVQAVLALRAKLEKLELSGLLAVGQPHQPLLDMPVREGRAGLVVRGGLNPVAALKEAGVPVTIRAMAGLESLDRFQRIESIWERYPRLW